MSAISSHKQRTSNKNISYNNQVSNILEKMCFVLMLYFFYCKVSRESGSAHRERAEALAKRELELKCLLRERERAEALAKREREQKHSLRERDRERKRSLRDYLS